MVPAASDVGPDGVGFKSEVSEFRRSEVPEFEVPGFEVLRFEVREVRRSSI
jgi:hypothetical protein